MSGQTEWCKNKEPLKTFIGGLPYHCDEEELEQFMRQFGAIQEIYVSKDSAGHHKGYAFVSFSTGHHSPRLFGEHSFKNKIIEVKRNLHNHLFLPRLHSTLSVLDIRSAIEEKGFAPSEIIIGTDSNGLATGTGSIRLVEENLLAQAALIGKLQINNHYIEIVVRNNKKYTNSHPKDSSSKKKNNKKNMNIMSIGHDGKHIQPISLQNGTSAVTNSNTDGIINANTFVNYHQYSAGKSINNSEQSTDVVKETSDACSFSEEVKRKLSSSLKTHSKEYYPFPKKMEFLEQVSGDNRFVTLSSIEEDINLLHPITRHSSESLTPSDFQDNGLNRRLSYYSSSFYTGNSPSLIRTINTPLLEIKIAFYTFPGRD